MSSQRKSSKNASHSARKNRYNRRRSGHYFSYLKYRTKRRLFYLLFFMLIALFSDWIGAQLWHDELTGQFQVVDGDTIKQGRYRLRLRGIDAPELEQFCTGEGGSLSGQKQDIPWSCGQDARVILGAMLQKQSLRCEITGEDKYNRFLSYCYIGEQDIGKSMVQAGYALATGIDYQQDVWTARKAKKGIWSGEFISPKQWREQHKNKRAQ